ncbi:MAG: L-2,4-diaminobutyrate transaminase [Paracoccaceae bacterium]|jgi:L-2,4-diaminobutyrate transaminase
MILDRAPDHMSKVYFGLSGSDANETNIKLVWYYNNVLDRPKKKEIIPRWRGYHGSGLMTGSLTGLQLFHNKFDLPLSQVIHTEAPYYYRRDNLDQSEAAWIQVSSATLELKASISSVMASAGVFHPRVFLGRLFIWTCRGLVPPQVLV